jgi:hypothetical protein
MEPPGRRSIYMRAKLILATILAGLTGYVRPAPAPAAGAAGQAVGPSSTRPLASIRLYNPTAWELPLVVKVPVGHLVSPEAVDWARVRLVDEQGRELPLAFHEGRPHWKAGLIAPLASPRAEDLLVFSRAVKKDAWVRIDLVAGPRRDQSAIADRDGRLVISYPGFGVTIDRATGLLTEIVVPGGPLLAAPLSIDFVKNPGPPAMRLPPRRASVRRIGQASTAAMTELDFELRSDERLAVGLTYRIHACGLIEVWVDERPWQGVSPWLDHAARINLPLAGRAEVLPYLVNRAPFYGFKDYAAAVAHVAAVYRQPRSAVLVLGEETGNGRRWNRSLTLIPPDHAARADALVAAAEQGLIVDLEPNALRFPAGQIDVVHPAQARVAAEILIEALGRQGLPVRDGGAAGQPPRPSVVLEIDGAATATGIEGDGFQVRPRPDGPGAAVRALSVFGLTQAARRIAEQSTVDSGCLRLPRIASNPVTHLRGAGFGGGDFEVDFPYGSDAEWEQALDQLAAGGINVMADLGMWSNWKMPVSYRRMPELRSTDTAAYDEVSGARFAEFAAHRRHGLKLLDFLHARGVKVWLWLPVGCVPTTYARNHPAAMAPGNPQCPCFTHPLYNRYLRAFLGELLETYPVDGVVMIRDDNGGLCDCPRCRDYLARSRTRSAAWEQYLILGRWLKEAGFRGQVAVYPYFDLYQPRLEPLLPPELLIVGHGSGAGLLARSYETLAPMGDTWLDNTFANFRVPTAARMRRLLADRNSFWIGGALVGSELAWDAIGQFGWEPTATVNTLRYRRGVRQFGRPQGLAFVALAEAYERLWEIYDLPMLPLEWVQRTAAQRRKLGTQGRTGLEQFRRRLADLRGAAGDRQTAWFRHLALFGTYFDYHLGRLERFSEMLELATGNRQAVEKGQPLAEPLRRRLLAMYAEIGRLAEGYDREAAAMPGQMIARTRANQLTRPWQEWVSGYDASLDGLLKVKQFAGELAVSPGEVPAGRPFTLRVRLRNLGVIPWVAGAGEHLEFRGDAGRLGLPTRWDYDGPAMAFGDRREIEVRGVAPPTPGQGAVQVLYYGRHSRIIAEHRVQLRWK